MSTIRMTGMISGLDTESIISQLVSAKSVKVNSIKKSQIKASWKQDAWKDLNKKIQNFQSKYVNTMRFASAYTKKTTKVSDSNVASVITGENAMGGTQELTVDQLAKTAYMTGGTVSLNEGADGSKVTALTKLSDIKGFEAGGSINISGLDEPFEINADTTVNDVLNKLKDAGLNANFDEKQQRFYVSAKESGAAADFSITANDENGQKALEALGLSTTGENAANKINGEDARITLNNVEYTSNSNSFSINGLTITAMKQTAPGEKVTVTTERDTDGIYDMIKDFVKEYSTLMNEMDKMYNATSANKYEPLLSEEKDALSDNEVEEWEKKIKDSLLRRDDNLNAVSTALQEIIGKTFDIGGKSLSLADFGIGALGYFESADNEKHALHIDGDADDSATANKADKLKNMISNEPDTVINFFSTLSKSLYEKMNDLSKSKAGYRSFGSFYDNTKMKTDYNEYAGKISEAEEKLNEYEDKWYKKFSAMETALAKMQSKSTAVMGMFGGQ